MAAMSDADILKGLREQVLDESESLVGLLRKCLALGAVTGSDELRGWANNELKGYPDASPVPVYRELYAPLFVDSTSGPTITRGQQISRIQVPTDLRHYVPEKLCLRQPVEELVQMASLEKAPTMTGGGFSVAAALWTEQLDMFQSVDALYYKVMPSTIAGIVGLVRTTLLEIVIDMAKDVPLDALPNRAKVDSVVQVHVGSKDSYQVSVGTNQGVIGQGPGSTQIQNNSVPTELTALIGQMRDALEDINDPDQRADAEQAIDDFEESVSEDDPQPEKIKRRSRMLEKVATAVGSGLFSGVAKEGVAFAAEHFHLLT
jgi:hypothetical protein